jgi:hypothetical protein
VTVADPLAPDCNVVIGPLAPGAHHARTCSKADVADSFVNRATVSGAVQGFPDQTFEINDDAAVTVVRYTIYLPKVTKNSN